MPTFPLNSVLIADVNVVIFALVLLGLKEKVLSGCLNFISKVFKMKTKKSTDLNEEKVEPGEIHTASG